ncbi:hypothetical protein ACL02P_15350 [Paenibacillus sp. MB22_1]|uniref:hypothetical protein n=1 Tax=Paenibacillus sp. MB22_1 TaxID=3383121 RepID=UPI0039A29528
MPGFKYVYNDYGKDPTRITEFMMKDNEAGTAGEAVKLDGGRWTKASGTDAIGGFLTSNVAAGTNQPCEVILAREGDWYDVPYTGTADTDFVEGANAVALATSGLALDAATVEGGSVAVLSLNTSKKTARVKVKNRQFS